MHRIPGVQLPETLQLASVTSPAEGDHDSPYVLHVIPVPRVSCPSCQRSLKPTAKKTRTVADLPIGDHPVLLKITTAMARCRTCDEKVACALPDAQLTASGKATTDLARYLLRQRGKIPLRTLAARTGLSHHEVRAVQQETAEPEGEMPDEVDFLGLDEIFFHKAKYLVAVDYSKQPRLLRLMRASDARSGRTSQSIPPEFFEGLPKEAKVISLDMNSEQMVAVKAKWPNAKIVIDRRHMIEALNRDLLRLTQQLVQARFKAFPNDTFTKQATGVFGSEAYAHLTLRGLVLKRKHSLTPADQARWLMLRRESRQAELLYEGYMWREALHELYDAALAPRALKVDSVGKIGKLSAKVGFFWQRKDNRGRFSGSFRNLPTESNSHVTPT